MSLADYELGQLLGRGGLAEVHLARARTGPRSGTPVVVKRLLPGQAGDQESVALLLREARLTARLRHPGLVEVLEAGIDEGLPYLILEHVDGPDLARLLASARAHQVAVPPAFALAIVHRAAEALHAAHGILGQDGRPLGLVHCDVSPANILLSRRGQVKVGDFGVARAAGGRAGTRALGKVRYLAPELATGASVDARTDVFGLGTVLHELLTGRPAFEGDDPAAVVAHIVSGARRPPSSYRPELSAEVDELVLKALAAAPGERFDDAERLASALASAYDPTGADDMALAALVRGLGWP